MPSTYLHLLKIYLTLAGVVHFNSLFKDPFLLFHTNAFPSFAILTIWNVQENDKYLVNLNI